MFINTIRGVLILSGVFLLCLTVVPIYMQRFGIANKLLEVVFYLFFFTVIIYIIQTKHAKD